MALSLAIKISRRMSKKIFLHTVKTLNFTLNTEDVLCLENGGLNSLQGQPKLDSTTSRSQKQIIQLDQRKEGEGVVEESSKKGKWAIYWEDALHTRVEIFVDGGQDLPKPGKNSQNHQLYFLFETAAKLLPQDHQHLRQVKNRQLIPSNL